jgi:hypothetical protein
MKGFDWLSSCHNALRTAILAATVKKQLDKTRDANMARGTEQPQLVWEKLNSSRRGGGIIKLGWDVHRAKVPGGWLLLVIHNATGTTFYPDPEHRWDGGSLT